MPGTQAFLLVAVAGILVALAPFLAVAVYVARASGKLWKAFLWGWGGWFLALLLRIVPVQVPQLVFLTEIQSSLTLALLIGLYASAMAGLFEEGIRFYFLKRNEGLRANRASLMSFALGWGIGEAIIIYVPAIAALPLVSESLPTLLEILPGALERNMAIVAHISLSFIVLRSLAGGKMFLGAAMLVHFGLNAAALSVLVYTNNVWLTELTLAIAVGIALVLAHRFSGGWQVQSGEPVPEKAL